MTRAVERILSEALELEESDRATLAGLLIESLDDEPDERWEKHGRPRFSVALPNRTRAKSAQFLGRKYALDFWKGSVARLTRAATGRD